MEISQPPVSKVNRPCYGRMNISVKQMSYSGARLIELKVHSLSAPKMVGYWLSLLNQGAVLAGTQMPAGFHSDCKWYTTFDWLITIWTSQKVVEGQVSNFKSSILPEQHPVLNGSIFFCPLISEFHCIAKLRSTEEQRAVSPCIFGRNGSSWCDRNLTLHGSLAIFEG